MSSRLLHHWDRSECSRHTCLGHHALHFAARACTICSNDSGSFVTIPSHRQVQQGVPLCRLVGCPGIHRLVGRHQRIHHAGIQHAVIHCSYLHAQAEHSKTKDKATSGAAHCSNLHGSQSSSCNAQVLSKPAASQGIHDIWAVTHCCLAYRVAGRLTACRVIRWAPKQGCCNC